MTRHASCCVPLSTNNFRNSLGLAFYRIRKARSIKLGFCSGCFGATAERPSLKLFHGAFFWFFLRKNRPRYTSAAHFMLFCLLIPPSVLLFWAVLTLLKHSFSLSAIFVYIRVPQNDPITVRVPSLGPRLSLFPEVSYGQQLKRMVLGNIYSWYNDDDLRKKLMRCEIYVVWGWVYELLKLLWGTRTQLTDTFFLACRWLLSFLAFELLGRRPFFLRYSGLSILRYLDLDFFPPFRKKSRVLACFPGGVKNYSWLLQKLGRIFSL